MAREIKSRLLTPVELSGFCAQLSMVIRAGIPVGEGVDIMLEEAENERTRLIMAAIHDKLEEGTLLFEALEASGAFPLHVINMTEIGEKTGRLDSVMDSLSAYYEREEAIRQSVKSAVTYPMVMVLVMLAVIGLLVIKVLPVFDSVFRDLGSEMSGFARTVMNLGADISNWAAVIIVVIAALIILYFVLRGTRAGRNIAERIKNIFPPTRAINSKITSGRFASAMSLMMSSGLDTDESLDMVYRLADTDLMRQKIDVCRRQVASGVGFAESLVSADLFSGIYARMITVGFKTGSVDTVMAKLADRYEDEIDERITSVISILEPTLVAILSILVGLILLSVMLPLMGVMSSIG